MHDLFATASEPERHLSGIAADVWGCDPYTDHDGTRYPLAMRIMGVTTAWHPEDAHGIHAVQRAQLMQSVDTHPNPPATVMHGTRDLTPPLPWRHACERVHTLVRAACPLPLPPNRPPEDLEIVFGHLMEDHWAQADGDGIRVKLMRFMDGHADPVTDPPFWNVVVWLDGKLVMNREVYRWHASHALTVAARLFNVFEGAGPSLRVLADMEGWAAVMRRFRME